jgi:hypothetical protein
LWEFYIQLVEIEAAFKNLKDDLALRPIFHQLEHRIEAHIFVAFMAYCLHVTLRVLFWTNLPPFRCSITNSCSNNSISHCRPNRHRASAPAESF